MSRYGIPDKVVSDSGSRVHKLRQGVRAQTRDKSLPPSVSSESAVKEAKKVLKKTAAVTLTLLAHLNTPARIWYQPSPASVKQKD